MARHEPCGLQEKEPTSGFHSQRAKHCNSLVRAYRLVVEVRARLTHNVPFVGLPGYLSDSPSPVFYLLVDSERQLLDYRLGAL